MFDILINFGVVGRAFTNKICDIELYNPRDFTTNNYKKVDDKPFGGGAGMIMKPDILENTLISAIEQLKNKGVINPLKIYLSPKGEKINQNLINKLSLEKGLIFVCGRYEGIDERFIENNVDIELSIGDFVVSGGELPTMIIIDAIVRQLPNVLNSEDSVIADSFMNGLLDYPHYTTPREYKGKNIPNVLLSGNHKQIELWRLQMSLWHTYKRRPDLLEQRKLTDLESRLLQEMIEQNKK
jgi:tRNA (guanine37-N1)-methyltransferase